MLLDSQSRWLPRRLLGPWWLGTGSLAWALLALGAGALWWFGNSLGAGQQLLLFGLLLLAFVAAFRAGRTGIFGPVLFYDLVRTGRRGRAVLMRAVYVLILFYI